MRGIEQKIMTAEKQVPQTPTSTIVGYTDHAFIHATLLAVAGIFTIVTFAGI